jgi:ubiquinone/menaquinone biosynthesis C-methylase UbiE
VNIATFVAAFPIRRTNVDQAKAEAFGGRMLGLLNDSFLGVLVSIGHRTGLFDVMAGLAPATSVDIAAAAKLDERYVREWLSAMTAGKIVDYDGKRGHFHLPLEHAGALTRASGPNNMAMMTQYIALVANVEDAVTECFRRGGGVPYSAFKRFQALQAEESAQIHDAALIDAIVPLSGMVERLRTGIDVLDVGCGQGHALNLMAAAFPNSRFAGYDFSDDGVAVARDEAARKGLSNVRFENKDVTTLEGREAFDLVTTFDVIHDLADPAGVLAAIYRALRSDGVYLCVDVGAASNLADNVDHPLGPLLYSASTLHCMTVSLAQGGPGLGTCWGQETALRMLAAAGFRDVEVKKIEGDILNNYYVCKKLAR